MDHCSNCLSNHLRSVRTRPIDVVLLPLRIRRYRCDFCHEVQCRWLVPRPLRWAMSLAVIALLYVASPGPVDWLHANRRLSDVGYDRLERWVYRPITWFSERDGADECSFTQGYLRYRAWWTADSEPGRPHSVAKPLSPPTPLEDLLTPSR